MNLHNVIKHPDSVEAKYRMENSLRVFDNREPLLGCASRRLTLESTPKNTLDIRSHLLYFQNPHTLFGAESATPTLCHITEF
jgi:hypothetical protein